MISNANRLGVGEFRPPGALGAKRSWTDSFPSRVPGVRAPMMLNEHIQSSVAPRPGRAGDARLGFERVGNRTVVRTALAHSPLRLLTPRNHGHAAWVYTSSLGGGLVDGDHL